MTSSSYPHSCWDTSCLKPAPTTCPCVLHITLSLGELTTYQYCVLCSSNTKYNVWSHKTNFPKAKPKHKSHLFFSTLLKSTMNILYSAFLFTLAHSHGLRTHNLEDADPTTPDSYCDWGKGYMEPSHICHVDKAICKGSKCGGKWHDTVDVRFHWYTSFQLLSYMMQKFTHILLGFQRLLTPALPLPPLPVRVLQPNNPQQNSLLLLLGSSIVS
jgi:hypothetical protein